MCGALEPKRGRKGRSQMKLNQTLLIKIDEKVSDQSLIYIYVIHGLKSEDIPN